jgi:hypothetical protein
MREPPDVSVIRVSDLPSFVPAIIVHVDPQRVAVGEELVDETPVASDKEIDLAERAFDLGVEP